jgi:hypothetical protein
VLELFGSPALLIGCKKKWTFYKCPKIKYTKLDPGPKITLRA